MIYKIHKILDKGFLEINVNDIKTSKESLISIDGSSTNTGISIINILDEKLEYCIHFYNEPNENPVAYKVKLKNVLKEILFTNYNIKHAWYEEPFIKYAEAAKRLLMMRTLVEEIKFENEPLLDYLNYSEISNTAWKKIWLDPEGVPPGTELQKEAIRKVFISKYPHLNTLTQDQMDSAGMGLSIAKIMNKGKESELISTKKVRPFKYKVHFMSTDYIDIAIDELFRVRDIPREVMDNGIVVAELGRHKFDEFIYQKIGREDRLLLLQFDAKKHGNLVLKYRLAHLLEETNNFYAAVWRKTRIKSA